MEIKIENQKLAPAINLLYGLSLKGQQSRHRTKFIRLLQDKLKEFGEEEKEVVKEHCNLDDKGEPKTNEDNTKWDIKEGELDAFVKDKEDLYKETRVIDGGDNQVMLKTINKVLEDCDKEFSMQEADTYDHLCDAFEKAEAKKESAK
jgi:hypothetical protein